jgi:hypothetical protein
MTFAASACFTDGAGSGVSDDTYEQEKLLNSGKVFGVLIPIGFTVSVG